MVKQYDTENALQPAGQMAPEGQPAEDMNYEKFVSELPEEFRAEFEEALAGMINYLHSEEGTTAILGSLKGSLKDIGSAIGKAALMAMDAADQEHKWSDSVKVFCGFFAVKEVSGMARAAGIVDIPEEQEKKIFETAAQNYIHYIIKSKPTQEEREAEAVRIQKEVEPLMTDKMRQTGHDVAQKEGVPFNGEKKPATGGLLE
jgi:hypothetical protein